MDQLQSTQTSLRDLELELSARILNLAAFLNLSLGDAAGDAPGNRTIRLESVAHRAPWDVDPKDFSLNPFRVGRMLPFLYEYAYQSKRRVDAPIDWTTWLYDDFGDREAFDYFLHLSGTDGVSMVNADNDEYVRTTGLRDMLEMVDARARLDAGEPLEIEDVASLARMSEKSVRNALRAEGDNQLRSADGEQVENAEALRWLQSRRGGFKETTVVGTAGDDLPESLSLPEIAPFIKRRLERFYPSGDEILREAATALGWPLDRVYAVTENAMHIHPQDCAAIAKAIRVDAGWFTEQVMCVLFPREMSLVMHRRELEIEPDTSDHVDVALTANAIKHGYLDIPATLESFFPSDCFGTRARNARGSELEMRYSSTSRMTDMRRKSAITISPRIRFGQWFSSVLGAKPGDLIRVTKLTARTFELTHIAASRKEAS